METMMPDNVQIWEALNDIRERVTRIESGLSAYVQQTTERCAVRAERLNKLESRMTEMEKRVWQFVGAAVVFSAVGTAAVTVFLQGAMK
jgi:tetrahydromethanopterin S-methyltransferase subunit G